MFELKISSGRLLVGVILKRILVAGSFLVASSLLSVSSSLASASRCDGILFTSDVPLWREGNRPVTSDQALLLKNQSDLKQLAASVSLSPKVLMASYESGLLKLTDGQVIDARFGGVGSVMEGLIANIPKYLSEKNQGGRVGFVFPAFTIVDVSKIPVLFERDILIAGRTHRIRVHKAESTSGASIYFLDSPLFKAMVDKNGKPSPYFPNLKALAQLDIPVLRYPEIAMTLLSRGTAEVFKAEGFNVFHGQDYFTGLVPYYIPREKSVQTVTIHSGKWYEQGLSTAFGPDFVSDFRIAARTQQLPTKAIFSNGEKDLDHDLRFEQFERFILNFNNTFISRLADEQIIGGMGVSEGQVKSFPKERKLSASMTWVVNGLDDEAHAKSNPFLRRITPQEIEKGNFNLTNHEAIEAFEHQDFNFGMDLATAEGQRQTLETKAAVKRLLQIEAFGVDDPGKPLFVSVGRLATQKNISLFAQQVETIVQRGGQVIVAGPVQDHDGVRTAGLMKAMARKYPQNVKFYPGFINGRLRTLIFAGSDFFALTSLYEPCGMTDMEAAWSGSIVLARRTGGLGKVKSGSYYEAAEPFHRAIESKRLNQLINEAIDEFYSHPERIAVRRLQALAEPFQWKQSIENYFLNYRTLVAGKQFRNLEAQAQQGSWSASVFQQKVAAWYRQLPLDVANLLETWLDDKVTLGFQLTAAESSLRQLMIESSGSDQ